MANSNIITGQSEEQIWSTMAEQLTALPEDKNYNAEVVIGPHTVTVDIDSHVSTAGEAEGITTLLTAQLPADFEFRFLLQKQNFFKEIRKLFGMQDIIVGNEELDKKYIIQTNDVDKIKQLLSDNEVCEGLVKFPVITYEIRDLKIGAHRELVLTTDIEGRITKIQDLKEVFRPLLKTLDFLAGKNYNDMP
jgi:hypothetical protein